MTRSLVAAVLLSGTAFVLAACGGGADEAATAEADAGIPGLAVENAKLVLPAVTGNPGAIYFDLVNEGDRNYAIRKAEVEGAGRAEIHGTMEYSGEMTMGETGPQTVQPGETLRFEPGALHVMAFDLGPEVKEGGSVEVTLTAAGGKTMSFPAEVRDAGDER